MAYGDKEQLKRLLIALYLLALILGLVFTLVTQTLDAGAQSGGATPLPPCPPEDSLGPGTPWPGAEDLSYDYLAACAHCLRGTPTPTSLLATYLPSSTPPADGQWHTDCPSSYRFEVDAAQGGAQFEAALTDKNPYDAIYGALFRFQTAYDFQVIQDAMDCDGLPEDLVPLWRCDSPSYEVPFELGQPYCAVAQGYEFLCAQFAPEARVLTLDSSPAGWVPYAAPGMPLALPFRVPGTDTGDVWLLDVRLLVYDSEVPVCGGPMPTPSPTPTPTASPSATPAVQGPRVWFTGAYNLVEGATTGTFALSVLDGGLAARAVWVAPEGAYKSQSSSWEMVTVDGPVTSMTLEVTGPAIPYREWYGTCAAVGDWRPRLNPSDRFPAEVVPIAGGYRYTYALNGTVSSLGGYANTYRACPTHRGAPTTYDWTVRIVAVNGVSAATPTPSPTPTATPQLGFVLGAERQNLMIYAESATCWTYDSLEWPGQSAAAEPIIGTCYNAVLQGEAGIEFAEMAASNDGYGAPWLSLWGDTTGPGAGVYRTCVTDGYTPPGGSLVSPGAVCAQACPEATRILGVGDWPKTVDGDYVGTWKVGCWKNGSLGITDMGLITYGAVPAATATPTPTATWLSPTPGATTDQCAVFDWREDLPAGSVELDWENLVVEGECYPLIPEVSVDVPGLPLGIGGGAHIEWDGFAVCVNWVRFPAVEVLGIGVSLDWFLLPALAWLVNRVLTL